MKDNNQWLTATQAATHLQIHVETLYKLVATGEVPARKVGARWRFIREELDTVGLGYTPTKNVARDNWKVALRAVNPYAA